MVSLLDRLAARRHAWVFPVLLGAVLFLPLLGSFGLWDPVEVRVADVAKEMAADHTFSVPNKPGALRPPLTLWLISAGFRTLGVNEWGGRLPIALAGLLAALACFYAGGGLLRRRGAFLGALALVTMPAMFLGSRQLVTAVPQVLAAALAVGGLARAAWPGGERDERLRLLHLGLGLAGLGLGYLGSGLLVGVLPPLLALAVALPAAGGPVGATVAALVGALAALGGVIIAVMGKPKPGAYSNLLGGTLRPSLWSVQAVSVLKQLGFGAFPWIALLPAAAARALDAGDENGAAEPAPAAASEPAAAPTDARRARFGRLVLLVWAGAAYIATTLQVGWIGDWYFPGFAALALLAGDYLDAVLDDERRFGMAGFVAFVGAVILAHDFYAPELFVSAHVLEGIKWAGPVAAAQALLIGAGIAWALAAALGLGLRRSEHGEIGSRQGMLTIAVLVPVVLAFASVYWLVPRVSSHLSYKGLFKSFQALGGGQGELGQYHVPSGTTYYTQGKATDLQSLDQLFAFLGKPARVFAIVSAEDMASIDQFARQRGATYYVVDDSNARFLLLSNRLDPGKKDLNPLRRLIVEKLERQPQHPASANFENKVELVGYDLPAELSRGEEFKITLYYKVLAPLPTGYKVFLHFDGPGNRFNGDHVPLDGKFPTNYWVPGFHVIDEHTMRPDRSTVPAGWFQIYTGFWLGDQRLKVLGTHDGENRVKIGTVRVR